MAAVDRGIWAIDIGSNALKALRLHETEHGLSVSAFDYVEHSTVLSAEDLTEDEIKEEIGKTLHTFVSNNDIDKKDQIAVSVAGNKSFARFVPLPPVETKDVPRVVQFEAVQQIPFDINEVEWGWQLMQDDESPEKIVGLFAIKNEILNEVLDYFTHEGLKVAYVQIAPMAIYNYLLYDRRDIGPSSGKATVILDMGSQDTTLIVATETSVWQRTIRIGGNSFTEAISEAFKVRFKKAEKLKRTAPVSKYVRQIFSAMKPVFTDYSSEIQRSLGFYTSNSGGKGYSKIIALGGGMKLKGLAKYLQQSLGIPVVKPDTFETLVLDESVSPARFGEHVSDFGICYGLGVQAFAQSKIQTNLLPNHIARAMAFARKAKMFNLAACVLVVVSFLCLGKALLDNAQYASAKSDRAEAQKIANEAKNIVSQVQQNLDKIKPLDELVKSEMTYFEYRDIVPRLMQDIIRCLPNSQNSPADAGLHDAFSRGDTATVKAIPRQNRKQLFITGLVIEYVPDVESASFKNIGTTQTAAVRRTGLGADAGSDFEMYNEFGMSPRQSGQQQEEKSDELATGPGFLVIIEGYSPYQNIGELMDPVNVGKNKSQWGLVTRLENLGQLEKKEKFLLFGKGNTKNFKQEVGLVDLGDDNMPTGIGVLKDIDRVPVEFLQINPRGGRVINRIRPMGTAAASQISTEQVLVDPMTNEEMSRVYDIITQEDLRDNPELTKKDIGTVKLDIQGNPKYIERDHWFRISMKLRWMGAPKVETAATGRGY